MCNKGGITVKKPNSLMQLLSFVFMSMGPTFIVAGYLNKIGILPTSPNSRGNPATLFPIVGIVFLLMGLILFFIPFYQLYLDLLSFLLLLGIRIEEITIRIQLLRISR